MTTIHQDIMRMTQEDMVDEIMTLREVNRDLVAALEEIEGGILGRDDYTPLEAAREMERIARAALARAKGES